MVEGPQQREHARVPRNHLPQLIHPGPWNAEKELIQHLRAKRLIRRSRHCRADGQSRGQIVDAISIRERPAEVKDRAIPGHWEGDLLAGSKNTHIATLVERHSRFVMLIKVPSKDTTTVVAALSKHVLKLPPILRRSLTWDRGHEMAKHKSFTVDTNVKVYFCDPQSPWQRGTNENTNGLLRQYFPKKTDLSVHTQAHLNKIALRLNQRPRETENTNGLLRQYFPKKFRVADQPPGISTYRTGVKIRLFLPCKATDNAVKKKLQRKPSSGPSLNYHSFANGA